MEGFITLTYHQALACRTTVALYHKYDWCAIYIILYYIIREINHQSVILKTPKLNIVFYFEIEGTCGTKVSYFIFLVTQFLEHCALGDENQVNVKVRKKDKGIHHFCDPRHVSPILGHVCLGFQAGSQYEKTEVPSFLAQLSKRQKLKKLYVKLESMILWVFIAS